MSQAFLRTMDGECLRTPPIWLMRQAGRYLPEYREIRATTPSFLEFCYNPKLAAEATLQPIRRFGFDAAIMFSDILVVPDAMGQKVWFEIGEGPKLQALQTESDIEALLPEANLERLEPMFETIERSRTMLPDSTALIGFCGAPWTVASYMIAGQGTPDQAPARLFAYQFPELFQKLIDKIVAVSINYLAGQIRAGADTVQIFDSWAGVLPNREFQRWCHAPVKAIIDGLRLHHSKARIIAFPRGVGTRLAAIAPDLGAQAIGLDTAADPVWAARQINPKIVLQGNLDPLVLLAGGQAQDRAVDDLLKAMQGRAHIFNLGHGILPQTPIAHVQRLLDRVRAGHQG